MERGDLIVDRFEIERLAGTGGMGAVYRARDLETGEPVALKVLIGTPRHEEELRFGREAQVIAELDHPGIVRHVAHGTTAEGRPFLAMEWIEGEDLATRLRRGALSPDEALVLARRVAEALGAAHARGVVHRDLKPSNLLLPGGVLAEAKIVDFGLATFPGALRATGSGMAVGTPAYMAPEQVRGERDAGARVDVFALGAILHECLAGRGAFEGQHVMAVLAKIVFDEVPRLRELGCAVPAALDALVARMLAKEPATRPADGAALQMALNVVEASLMLAAGEAGGEPAPESAGLTLAEQRMLCLVLARRPRGAAPDPVADTVSASGVVFDRALAALEAHGGRSVLLADGTLAVTVPATGLATDQAALAATCALALREALPRWAIAVVTGRGEVAAARPVGEAIERAAQRIRARQGLAGEPPVDIDEISAGLLDVRFDVTAGALGLELRGERDVAEAPRTLLGRPTPFVGRDRDIAMLEALFAEHADDAVARAVLITGPAGVGKSRLRHEMTERLRRRGAPVWLARGDPMRAGASFGLVAQLVRHAARLVGGEPVEIGRQKLLGRVARHVVTTTDQLRVAEFLGELAGTPFSDTGRVQLHAARQDPRLLGDQMRRAWVDLVDAECRAQPLVIVLEDLHWGDGPSVELVDAALRSLRDRPLVVLAMARPEVHDRFPKLWHDRGVQEMRLLELPRRACERLVHDVLGARAAGEVATRLWERSAGNAFFLEELLRATAEGRAEDLPGTLLAMVESRLDALDAEDRRLLRAGSVFGEVFWRGGLEALLGAGVELDERLARLAREEWIGRRAEARLRGEEEYAFRHAIVREAAYGTLTEEDRARGHRLAAAWLEAAGETDALALAEHAERGGDGERAVRWYARAAELALEGNDLASVVARVDRAVALGASGETLGGLARARAIAHNWQGDHAAAEGWAARAMDLLPPGSAGWCAALSEGVWAAATDGDGARVAALGRALLASADASEVTGTTVAAMVSAANWLLMTGQPELAEQLRAEATRLSARLPDDPEVAAAIATQQATSACYGGDHARARALFLSAIALSERAGDLRKAWFDRGNVASLCVELGAYAEAEQHARTAVAAAEDMGMPQAALWAKSVVGLALAHQGAIDEACSLLRALIRTFGEQGDVRYEGVSCLYLAAVLRLAGQLDGAATQARRAVTLLADVRPMQPAAVAVLAEVLLAQGRVAEALEQACAAKELLASAGQVEEGEGRIHLAHAEALHAAGELAGARVAIATARERLLDRAARIGDVAWRQSFLDNVPENARTLALARAWLDEPSPS